MFYILRFDYYIHIPVYILQYVQRKYKNTKVHKQISSVSNGDHLILSEQ